MGRSIKDATKSHFNQLVGELKIEMKLNFARIRAERNKLPAAKLEAGPTQMTAAVDVSKAGISKTFTTRNTLTDNHNQLVGELKIEMKLNFARIRAERNKLPAANQLFENMVQAFTTRAKEVYRVG
jgi:ribosome-associated toxin RatA of RatAB toxin-antitoxin module